MAILRLKVAAKILITFGEVYLDFIRGTSTTKTYTVSFSNGTGQSLTAGQVLYSTGTQGQSGYLAVRSSDNKTLSGSGTMSVTVEHYPTTTEGNKVVTVTYDQSPLKVNLTYNSVPETTDIIIDVQNRTTKTFALADFTGHYTDYDSDQLSEIALFGDVTGYKYNGADYVVGQWITAANIGLLTYVPIDQNAYYEKDVTWKAKDINGNISIN